MTATMIRNYDYKGTHDSYDDNYDYKGTHDSYDDDNYDYKGTQ